MIDPDTPSGWPRDQLIVVAICVLALLFAAAAAPQPVADDPEVSEPRSNGTATAPAPNGSSEDPAPGGEGTRSTDDSPRTDGIEPVRSCSVVVDSDAVAPGDSITVLVRSPRGPVSGATILFNDRAVGVTDETGTVTATVPYERPLTVAARLPANATCEAATPVTVAASGRAADPIGAARAGTATPANETVTRTVRVVGRAAIEIEGPPYPGEEVAVRATIDDQPLGNATVTLDGEEVGRTDADGRASVVLPEGPNAVRVAVERGDFGTDRVVDIAHLRASLSSSHLFATPGDPAQIRVRAGDRPLSEATIFREGQVVARVDREGIASVRLPADLFATYRVEGAAQTTTVAVWPRYLLTALFGVLPMLVGLGVVGLLGVAVLAGRSGAAGSTPEAAGRSATDSPGEPTPHDDLTRDRLRERWRAFARRVAPRDWATTPPAAIADRAIAAGDPADPVRAFATVFREVEYGDRPFDADRRERVRRALADLEGER